MANIAVDEGYVAVPKRFPLALAIGLAAQAGGLVWYAAKIDARTFALEQADHRGELRFGELRSRVEVLEKDRDRLTKVETIVIYIGDAVKRIEQKLEAPRVRP